MMTTWTGEHPRILFAKAANEPTSEHKQNVAKYVSHVYTTTTALPERNLQLISVLPAQHPWMVQVMVQNKTSGHQRPFFVKMSAAGEQDYQDVGEQLLSICLTIVHSLLSHEMLHKHVERWDFQTNETNELKSGLLSYRSSFRMISFDLTDERFWEDGTFRGDWVLEAIKTLESSTPITENMEDLHLGEEHCTSERGTSERGTSVMAAVRQVRERSFTESAQRF